MLRTRGDYASMWVREAFGQELSQAKRESYELTARKFAGRLDDLLQTTMTQGVTRTEKYASILTQIRELTAPEKQLPQIRANDRERYRCEMARLVTTVLDVYATPEYHERWLDIKREYELGRYKQMKGHITVTLEAYLKRTGCEASAAALATAARSVREDVIEAVTKSVKQEEEQSKWGMIKDYLVGRVRELRMDS